MGIAIESLDTHRFQDLVDAAKRQINLYCPEWTNHNVSDPGVALVELFAWMTEMTLFQLDKVPDREMAVLLNSVGFEMFPAQAATADLTFSLAPGTLSEVVVPAKTTVAAPLDGREIFETETELRIVQPEFSVCRAETRDGVLTDSLGTRTEEEGATVTRFDEGLVCFDGLEQARADWRAELGKRADLLARAAWSPPHERFPGDVIYFGFEKPLSRAVVRAAFEVGAVSGLGIDPDEPPLIWESSTKRGWNRCRMHGLDSTGGLNQSGKMEIQVGEQHDPMILATGQPERFWLRLRIDLRTRETERTYLRSPILRSVAFSTIGGTIPAVNAARHERQVVGVSDGTPGQRLQLDGSILGGRQPTEVWVGDNRWTSRDDFAGATETSRVFVVDEAAGEVVFGPLVHQAVGAPRQHGAVPPDGATIHATYCTGGGPSGNVQPNRITSLQTAIPGIGSVINLEAASGGVERETLEEALRRAPAAVRAGDRAVTAGDFERIVLDAARDLHSVTCRPPDTPGGTVQMLIVPSVPTIASEQTIDDYALSPSLCAQIIEQLESRRLVGTTIELTTPFYLGVTAVVRVRRASEQASTHGLRDSILRKLFSFINPIEGGETGRGLGYGEVITAERIADQVRRMHGVDAVDVALFEVDVRKGERLPGSTQRIELPPDTLFMSYRHHVLFLDEARSS